MSKKIHALYGRVPRGEIFEFWRYASLVNDFLKPLSKFGRNVARLRNDLGLTQEMLAERVEVHPRYLQKLEAGTAHPSLMVLCRFKTSLNCDWNELLQGVA